VKFEVRFAISFTRKSNVLQKVMLFMGGGPSFFQKAVFQKFGSISVFCTGGCQEHLVLVQIKVNSKSEIRSFRHLAESEILIVHKSNQRNSSGISIPLLKFDPGNREGSQGDSFK
jgi:hypothetical protein